jgi:hypothetical protein
MKQRIGTALDQRVVRRAKVLAAQRGQPLNAVIEEALRAWLDRAAATSPRGSLIAQTAGNLAIDPAVLATLLREDFYDTRRRSR